MKKIVIDARELRTSTGRYVERLLYYLQEVDTDLSHRYIVLLTPKDVDTWEPKSKRFSKVACRYKEFSFGEQLGLAWQVYRLKPDLMHFAMIQQPILYFGKVVTTAHDITNVRFTNPSRNKYLFAIKRWVYIRVIKIVAHKSKAILTPSEFVKQDVAKFSGANSRKFTVTLEAVDDFDGTPEPMPEFADKQFIMFNGQPKPHKNLQRLLQAFVILHEKHPYLYLMLAGKKNKAYKSYIKTIESLGLSDRVVLTGFIPDGQLKWAMQNSRAYVYPSLSEGFGLPPLEAMLNSTPVVASNATCIPEVCGDAAAYFDPLNVEDIAKAIDKVISSEKRRAELIEKGHHQVKRYSWKRMAEQTLTVYKDILKES